MTYAEFFAGLLGFALIVAAAIAVGLLAGAILAAAAGVK